MPGSPKACGDRLEHPGSGQDRNPQRPWIRPGRRKTEPANPICKLAQPNPLPGNGFTHSGINSATPSRRCWRPNSKMVVGSETWKDSAPERVITVNSPASKPASAPGCPASGKTRPPPADGLSRRESPQFPIEIEGSISMSEALRRYRPGRARLPVRARHHHRIGRYALPVPLQPHRRLRPLNASGAASSEALTSRRRCRPAPALRGVPQEVPGPCVVGGSWCASSTPGVGLVGGRGGRCARPSPWRRRPLVPGG